MGRHRAENKRVYWRCPTGCGMTIQVDLDALIDTGLGFLSLFGVPDGWDWLPTDYLETAEQMVEKHECEHAEAA